MDRLQGHRAAVDRALAELGLGWERWPAVVAATELTDQDRLSALVLLLATNEADTQRGPDIRWIDPADNSMDWLGRSREPWAALARRRFPWTAPTAALAVEAVARGAYDDRRAALALAGAEQVCSAGDGDAALLEALDALVRYLDSVGDEQWRIVELRNRVRRVVASAAPPDILDLSLLADGDAWAGPARAAARELPAADVAPFVRLVGGLGPRKPSQRWWGDIDRALQPLPARQLLRRWTELAAATAIVPEWPGSKVGHCRGALFLGTNVDLVRATVLASSRLRSEGWPAESLGVLARRGSAHNGMAEMPEALCLKVAIASVDALALRAGADDRAVLADLLEDVVRRDLLKRITASLSALST